MGVTRSWRRFLIGGALGLALAAAGAGCTGDGGGGSSGTGGATGLSGTIEIDGSSTVAPITEAVAEEFEKVNTDVRILVGISGTGGGFTRFTAGETDISDASRPIKEIEADAAAENGISYLSVTVALDGVAVIVSPRNDFVDCLTTEELNNIWKPDSTVDSWNDVRASYPDRPLNLYGPDTQSGTFDYFTAVINGDEGVSRSDYVASSDDNVLVQGVRGDRNSLGYFGYAYYTENRDSLKLVGVDAGRGCVEPSDSTVSNGSYAPLARPIFIYVDTDKLKARPELKAFVDYYLEQAPVLVQEVGYTALTSYASEQAKVNEAYAG